MQLRGLYSLFFFFLLPSAGLELCWKSHVMVTGMQTVVIPHRPSIMYSGGSITKNRKNRDFVMIIG